MADSSIGTVYLIQRGAAGPIRVGYTRNLAECLRRLQAAHSEPLYVVFSKPGTRSLAQWMQTRWEAHRIRGDWFRPSPQIFMALANHWTLQVNPDLSRAPFQLERVPVRAPSNEVAKAEAMTPEQRQAAVKSLREFRTARRG